MIRSRPLALLAALLLLPGEAARAGAWCGVAGGAAMTHQAARASRAADATPETPMPASHAAHHAMMMHEGAGTMTDAASATAAVDDPGAAIAQAGHAAPTDAPAPTPPRSQADCPLMAACASAAVSITVRLSDGATRNVTERANADEPDALATRSIAPEPPPPR